jgi:hypothetical protein
VKSKKIALTAMAMEIDQEINAKIQGRPYKQH